MLSIHRYISCWPLSSHLRGNLRRSLYSTDFHRLHLSGWEPFRNGTDQVCCEGIEAVARAVKSLRTYYYNLCVQRHPKFRPPSSTYPSTSRLRLRGSLEFKIRIFFEQKPNYHGSLFIAEYGRKPVLVKFCESYGEAAHRVLAAAGLAPALRYCSQIVGGAFMVIMDLIDGPDAGRAFNLPPRC